MMGVTDSSTITAGGQVSVDREVRGQRYPTLSDRPARGAGSLAGVQNRLMAQRRPASTIRFEARSYTIGRSTLLRLPEKASLKLPSRGQVAVRGKINGLEFQTVLEPDGDSGHWMRVDPMLVSPGDSATLEVEPVKEGPEPSVPPDLMIALARAPQTIQDLWKEITPMARWEWVRWVNATPNPDTRKRRVELTISKMRSGKRRPCCFNLAACTDPNLSKNGKLPEPA